MATKNIIGPEREENQQPPPATPTCRVLNHIFLVASTPYNIIHNQFQPQEVAICELESELNINNSPSDITSTPNDHEPHLGSSNGGNQNEERIEINEVNLIYHQEEEGEEAEETISIAPTSTKALQKKRKKQKRIQTKRKKQVKGKKKVT